MKAGDIVKVKVLEVEADRKRIALTMRLDEQPQPKGAAGKDGPKTNNYAAKPAAKAAKVVDNGNAAMGNAFAAALAKLKK